MSDEILALYGVGTAFVPAIYCGIYRGYEFSFGLMFLFTLWPIAIPVDFIFVGREWPFRLGRFLKRGHLAKKTIVQPLKLIPDHYKPYQWMK